jgi:hypothetical protein
MEIFVYDAEFENAVFISVQLFYFNLTRPPLIFLRLLVVLRCSGSVLLFCSLFAGSFLEREFIWFLHGNRIFAANLLPHLNIKIFYNF